MKILNTSVKPIPSLVSQYGKICSSYQSVVKTTQIISFCSFSLSPKYKWNFQLFPFKDFHLIQTFSRELISSSRSFFILSNKCDTGISVWCNLCASLSSSSFSDYQVDVYTITGDNEKLHLYSGEVKDGYQRFRAASAIGCHHCCTFIKQGLSPFSIWNLSVLDESTKMDRGWSVLRDVLTMMSKKQKFIPFDHSELTKSMKSLCESRLCSSVFLVDDVNGILEMADLIQKVFQEEKKVDKPVVSSNFKEVNALRNELFVNENDVDAYEDEIRRLNRTLDEKNRIIESLQTHSFLVCCMKGGTKSVKQQNSIDNVVKLANECLQGKTLTVNEKLQLVMLLAFMIYVMYSDCNCIIQKGSSIEFIEKVANIQISQFSEFRNELQNRSPPLILKALCDFHVVFENGVNTLCNLMKLMVFINNNE